MRRGISGLCALALAVLLAGNAAGQEFQEVPPSPGYLPGPLGHPHMEAGGIFFAMEFLYMTQTNPIGHQVIATRGFEDLDGSITGIPNNKVGSGNVALDAHQVNRGQGTFVPGYRIFAGWRFEDGLVLTTSYMGLLSARYSVTASLLQRNLLVGVNLADTFMFSPVYNFPADFAGPPQKVNGGKPGATFGIWNGASNEQLTFLQRFDSWDIVTARVPVWQTDNFRTYGLFGPRYVHFWERFTWRAVAADENGASSSTDVAIYSNVVSNNLYGLNIGTGNDWWLGASPIGGFSATLDAEAGLYWDFVKERAKYELGDRTISAHHSRNVNTLAPGFNAKVSLWYYPWEAVQIQLGYNVMGFFNTISSPHPVDFNYGSISPKFDAGTFRLLNGMSFGVGIAF